MKHLSLLSLLLLLSFDSRLRAATWPLDTLGDTLIAHVAVPKVAPGATGQSLALDGTSLLELKDSAKLVSEAFTVSLWFNPYDLAGGQQMLAGKNRYSRNEREWSLTIEPDGKLKAHLQQGGWSTISCAQPLVAGKWHSVVLVADANKAVLYLNGKTVGEVKLKASITATAAPITLGGIWDLGKVRQSFHGALDDFSFHPRVLSAKEISEAYRPVLATHPLPVANGAAFPLWAPNTPMPKVAELPLVSNAEFHVVKKGRPDADGCNWTLGVGLAWHKGKLYASYGFNKGSENTPTEEAHVRVSDDGGKTWGKPVVMDAGEGNLGVSHGVFLSSGGRLWAFMGAFYDRFQRTHTRAYALNESSGEWEPKGVVIGKGFWPMQEPQKMADGNWIMAGLRVSNGFDTSPNLPAVAISKGDDFSRWDMVVIPAAPGLGNIWGESTVIVEGKRILNIARYGKKALALASWSEDYGRTWTPAAPSNLPMAISKPYAGILSTGQRYLVCTTTADTGGKRSPLTIAVSKPGDQEFNKVFVIRPSEFKGTPGVSDPKADFSYPYAVEHDGKLYVGYTHKSHAANELAVIPITSLKTDPDVTPERGARLPGLVSTEFIFETAPHPQCHASTIVETAGGLVAAWFGGTKEGNPDVGIWLSRHRDGKWTTPVEVANGAETEDPRVNCLNPVLFQVPDGPLLLFYKTGKWWAYVKRSSDGGATWSKPERLDNGLFGPIKNKAVVLADGSILSPTSAEVPSPNGRCWRVHFERSTNGGKSWELLGPVNDGHEIQAIQPSILFHPNNRLQALGRTQQGRLFEVWSEDGGLNWGKMSLMELPNNNSGTDAVTLRDGRHVLVYNHAGNREGRSNGDRSPLNVAVSKDGKIWEAALVLESEPKREFSYPAVIQTRDGLIHITYTYRRQNIRHVVLDPDKLTLKPIVKGE